MHLPLLVLLLLALSATLTSGQTADVRPAPEVETSFSDLGENLALHKPYTLEPRPSYPLCSDPGDKAQLTDGVYTQGYFWTQLTTVGWDFGFSTPAIITLDLGQDYPLKGLSYSTAADFVWVKWPAMILVSVSPDGRSWYAAGNLVQLNRINNLPESGEYAVRRLWTDQLSTHGRYVALYIDPAQNSFTFVDEIEVFRGDNSFLQQPYTGVAFADPKACMAQSLTSDIMKAQFRRALEAADADIAALPAEKQAPLKQQSKALAAHIDEFLAPPMEGFQAILPTCPLEADIFRLQAAAWGAQGKPALLVWTQNRWDMLNSFDEPAEPGIAPLEVHLMNNETRATVINFTNAGDTKLEVGLKVTGLPGGTNPAYLKVREVMTVGTRRFVPVAAPLPEARLQAAEYRLSVPPGMSRQMWLSFKPEDLPAGTHKGLVEIASPAGPRQSVPLSLVVYPFRFPDQTTLCVGGWDYTDRYAYGITAENHAEFVKSMQECHVNAPWAQSEVLGGLQFDADGAVQGTPSSAAFDRWVKLWPNARMYLVFVVAGEEFAGSKIGDPLFGVKVGNWARFWQQHMLDLGLKPNQLGLLILDEPSSKAGYDLVVAWARAIKATAPDLVIWEDPQPQDLKDLDEMFSTVDVLCPTRGAFMAREEAYRNTFLAAQKQGKELWFYNADSPARTFDPFSYYLVQEWHCFRVGAKGSCFWAFSDSGGGSCWNEYPAQGNGPYCPAYLDPTSVTTAKYMEAIGEGAQDYEYLTMLQNRVEELRQQGTAPAKLAAAVDLLVTGPERVMAGEKGTNYRWDQTKDRGSQDRVRVEILKMLTELLEP